ncbi:MAG TPA: tetratricopeptide repeat protein [Polyangiaceae bacterium]
MRALGIVLAAFASACAGRASPPVVALPSVEAPAPAAVRECTPRAPATCHAIAQESLPTEPRLAYRLEAFACDSGVPAACGALGHMMLHGIWGESSPEQALFYLEGACGAGVAASCVDLGVFDRDVRHEDARAIARFTRDCEVRRVAAACDELGRMVEDGRAFAPDAVAARRMFEHACTLGDAAGCGDLGRVTLESDRARAMHLLASACRSRDGRACYELGRVATTTAGARSHFERACNLGVAAGCVSVAWTIDPAERLPEAQFWIDRACDERDARACERLAERLGAPELRARAERIEAK